MEWVFKTSKDKSQPKLAKRQGEGREECEKKIDSTPTADERVVVSRAVGYRFHTILSQSLLFFGVVRRRSEIMLKLGPQDIERMQKKVGYRWEGNLNAKKM